MRSYAFSIVLAALLAFGVACNKPNPPATDNSNQPQDNTAQQGGSGSNQQQAPFAGTSQGARQSAESRAPESVTVPSGKVLTVRLADPVGSKISQPGQSFGGTLAKPVEVEGQVAIPAGARVSGVVVDAKP